MGGPPFSAVVALIAAATTDREWPGILAEHPGEDLLELPLWQLIAYVYAWFVPRVPDRLKFEHALVPPTEETWGTDPEHEAGLQALLATMDT